MFCTVSVYRTTPSIATAKCTAYICPSCFVASSKGKGKSTSYLMLGNGQCCARCAPVGITVRRYTNERENINSCNIADRSQHIENILTVVVTRNVNYDVELWRPFVVAGYFATGSNIAGTAPQLKVGVVHEARCSARQMAQCIMVSIKG